jgi:hypothetical protein
LQLIQVLLPLFDNDGSPLPQAEYQRVAAELTERFGGLTAFTRAPAEGLWKDESARTTRDDIVVLEVMAEAIDRGWWRDYRRALEERFRQTEIVIRAQMIERL